MIKINAENPCPFPVASGATVEEGDFVAITSGGEVVSAANTSGTVVAGVAYVVHSGYVWLAEGTVCVPNDATSGSPVARADRGKPCYLTSGGAVAASGAVVAGLVADVDDDGVFVTVTNTALAAARANA